jgi:uncharacterized protein (DUF1697 family)
MNGWVALLRAINVGGRNRVPMAELRLAFEEAGCQSVRSYIASGNVVFASRRSDRAALGRALEAIVADEFGVSTAVVLRTFAEIRELVRAHPFGKDTTHTYVTFLAEKPKAAAVRRVQELDVAPDQVALVGTDAVIQLPNGIQGARLSGPLLEQTLGVAGTNRNWRTVARLAELTRA